MARARPRADALALPAPGVAARMVVAARAFLGSLDAAQRATTTFPFASERRFVWDYRPVETTPRNGLRLADMAPRQQARAWALAATGLSRRGLRQTREIIALEPVLGEIERRAGRTDGPRRDPSLYAFAIFGEPGGADPWGWQVGGHHLGIHFTLVPGDPVAPLPLFFGANPAQIPHGPRAGTRTLAEEEELARALLDSLAAVQKAAAVVDPRAPDDILTQAYRRADASLLPVGVAYRALSGEQRGRLVRLVRHYVDRVAGSLAAEEWRRIERAGLEPVTFAWAGPEQRGQGHYYALRGPTFLVEYDNTQNQANHVHSVWRDPARDWAEDLLATHYATHHAP